MECQFMKDPYERAATVNGVVGHKVNHWLESTICMSGYGRNCGEFVLTKVDQQEVGQAVKYRFRQEADLIVGQQYLL